MYKLDEETFYYDEADGIGVAINFTNGFCYTMNRIGTAMFRELMGGAAPEMILSFFENISGCPENFRELALAFIGQVCEYGILTEDAASCKAELSLSEAEALEGFEPEISEFRDAQDLIMADPVHDIDPDLGWPAMD